MENNTGTQGAVGSSAAPTPSAAPAAVASTAAPAGAGQPSPTSQRSGHKLHVHPLWLAAGVAILFGLVFGVAAATASTGTSSTPSGSALEQTTINVIQAVDPSVVQVQASRGGLAGGGLGSGEILTTSGYIVTNSHVVHGFTSFTVLLASGQQVPAQLVGEAPPEDLAVLKISASNLKPIAVGDSSTVQVGEFALAIGSPLGLEQSATSGIVSALNRSGREVVDGNVFTLTGMIQTSAPINPGNSGGALVNLQGQLVGIPTLGAVDPSSGVAANGIGFAIASNHMEAIVHQLTNGAV